MWLTAAEELIAQLLEFCLKGSNCSASFGVLYFAELLSDRIEEKEGRKIEVKERECVFVYVRGSPTSLESLNRIVRYIAYTQKS